MLPEAMRDVHTELRLPGSSKRTLNTLSFESKKFVLCCVEPVYLYLKIRLSLDKYVKHA